MNGEWLLGEGESGAGQSKSVVVAVVDWVIWWLIAQARLTGDVPSG